MTLQEAIEIVQHTVCYLHPGKNLDEHDAIQLLIGAGERLEAARDSGTYLVRELLPGETTK